MYICMDMFFPCNVIVQNVIVRIVWKTNKRTNGSIMKELNHLYGAHYSVSH
jgi:hypothetical protein